MFCTEYWIITIESKVNIMKKDTAKLKMISNKKAMFTLTKYLMDLTNQHSSDSQIHLEAKLGFFLDLPLGYEFSSFEDIPTYPITAFTTENKQPSAILTIDNPNIATQVFEEHNGIYWNNKYQINEVYKLFHNDSLIVAIVNLYTYDVRPVYKKAIIIGCKSPNLDSNRLLKILLGIECKNYYFNNIHFYEPVKSAFGYTYVQEKQIKQYHKHTDTLIIQLIQDFENLKQNATDDIGLQEETNFTLQKD